MHNLRKKIYIPALNKFVSSLTTRLEKVSHASTEISKLFLDPKEANLQAIVESYGNFMPGTSTEEKVEKLKYEVEPWKIELNESPLKSFDASDIPRFDCYPSLSALFKILVIFPSSNAVSERTFSNLEATKTKKRSTMGQERLSGLSVISSN